SHVCRRALDDLVELPAIQPHAAAGRAIVDLDAGALRHDELRHVDRARHAWRTIVHDVLPIRRGRASASGRANGPLREASAFSVGSPGAGWANAAAAPAARPRRSPGA